MTNIGFIGLGIMGKPMAGHLIKGGHSLFLHSRSRVPGDLVALGGREFFSPKEVAQHADIIITMLPDTPDVEKVLFGENGIIEELRLGSGQVKTIVDMSSISPLETRKFAARINALGHDYVDAPVSGGDVGAQNAMLTIMVGANATVFEKVRPILGLLGKNVVHVGENGAGQVCKIANQIIVSSAIEAVAEALLFVSKAGVDPDKVRRALLGGFAASRVLEVHGERMINRCFEPGFRIELHQKDLNIALDSASALGVSLPNTATVRELFSACLAHGGAKWDNSAIVKILEKLADHEIRKHLE
ncbi:2-hydroxy-3-oxopropionate reductase [Nitrosomonas ureae]|uniref:2-hydroxy-3-oxopropionate reductase n=1 Tax=Nitrosomonas ureae TaxID=44577 RepID=A0A0S3AKF2_9PROT|nr:2-hydroxy-3-oxopropionate reductase [Nitrosomonas ureae]ALQ51510.1 2-hydroxy-3-oxopropionate reductase [Nitrosomonas ureae]SDT98905.1 2-hydroxy-3-oxopropionate reductase [Nitrosomonas ureae]SEQ44804.1 2-hydroxy-3-oxopropionate reductase [Nitrosomonas ureae]